MLQRPRKGKSHNTSDRPPATLTADYTTLALLVAEYNGRPLIPLDEVRADYFPHLTLDVFMRKLSSGDIPLPVMRIEASQKSPRSVHLRALAAYLDKRQGEAEHFVKQMTAAVS